MTQFSVGDQVVIRFGKQQGQKAMILKQSEGDVYKVKVEDGSIHFFSSKGLELAQAQTQQSVSAGGQKSPDELRDNQHRA